VMVGLEVQQYIKSDIYIVDGVCMCVYIAPSVWLQD